MARRPPGVRAQPRLRALRGALGAVLERWHAVHFTTPAATTLAPGLLGVIGNAAYGDVPGQLRELDVCCVVVLGSRLGTASGGANPDLFPEHCHIVQFEIDPDVAAASASLHMERAGAVGALRYR